MQNEMRFSLDNPVLWWPKGIGESALYEAKIEVVGKGGEVLASDVRNVGVRLVTLERDDVYGPDRPGQFLFRVNGEPCYIRGSNWVPLDSFPSRQTGRIVETLEMFEDLNCNMVRVWGGGVYEPHEFFDWCDAHGLMVWQDFMTGCSVFPQDDRYAAATAKEAKGRAKFTDAATGKVLLDAGEFEIPPNGKLALGSVPFSGQGVILIDATLDGNPYRSHFLYGAPPFNWGNIQNLLP